MGTNYGRRRAIQKRMRETGEKWSAAARAVDAVTDQRCRPEPEPEVWPVLTGLPTVQVAHGEHPGTVYEWGQFGLIERTTTGWLITPADSGDAHNYARANPLVRVDYRDPEAGEPRVTELPPLVRAIPGPSGVRWTWACNGWAVDEPGDVADLPAAPAPSTELPYEVRTFSLLRQGMYPIDWVGSAPAWRTLAWCYELDVARALAEGAARRPRESVARAQVWGPADNGERQALYSVDSTAELRASHPGHRTWGTLPAIPRPDAPPPTPEPAWDNGVPVTECPQFNARAWSPDTGWSTLLWASHRNKANIAAECLLIGVTEEPYPYGDVWGPNWTKKSVWIESEREYVALNDKRDGYALMDYRPDESFAERTARYRVS